MKSEHRNSNIEIKSRNENGSIFTDIFIDGNQIKGVRRFKLEREVGNSIPILTLDLNALNISVDTECLAMQEGFGALDISFNKDTGNGLIVHCQ